MRTRNAFLTISILLTFAIGAFGQNIEPMFTTPVDIYLHKTGVAPNGAADTMLRPVERIVPVRETIEHTLRALFDDEIPEEEQEAGFVSPTVGMKFESVTVRRGVATVKVSQLPTFDMEKSLGDTIFLDAITKTLRQFRSIRRVRICAFGKTTIDAGHPFERC